MLTKKQILRMPAKDYMNEEQLEFFKGMLLEMRAENEREIAEAKELLSTNPQTPDISDNGTDNELDFMDSRVMERKSQLIIKIDEALERIANGTYGFCRVTGNPIGIERLLLRPTATLSVEAKEEAEEKER